VKEDLKYKILKASLDLLEEGDVSALSMREVARRAGVSHQAPYHYFADREAILAELVRDGFERLHQDETSAVDAHDDQKDKIAALGESYVQFALENPSLFRLMFRCDMVDLDKHPDAKAAANKAFDVPIRVMGSNSNVDEATRFATVIGCWSMAHGLATLALEGVLTNKLADLDQSLDDLIRNTVKTFTARLPD
tara:strand:- start:610 stop:1191 length:582 start_codon:yes stop_codon:yes gene_type:complete